MKTLVVYYSLSGTTRTVAQAIAKELDADVEEIRCARYQPGFWGFVKAGYDSWRHRLPAIEELKHAASAYDLVLVGGPMWAFHAATPVRAYLRKQAGRLADVAFFLTHGGAPADKAFREMQVLAARAPISTLVVRDQDAKAGRFTPAVASFAAALRVPQAA
jgi:menaquinone-dependent protoporphyrinogen IX oxidase